MLLVKVIIKNQRKIENMEERRIWPIIQIAIVSLFIIAMVLVASRGIRREAEKTAIKTDPEDISKSLMNSGDYLILEDESSEVLAEMVNLYMQNGYEPLGGLSITKYSHLMIYSQAMIKAGIPVYDMQEKDPSPKEN